MALRHDPPPAREGALHPAVPRDVPLAIVLVSGIGLIVVAAVGRVVLMGYQVARRNPPN